MSIGIVDSLPAKDQLTINFNFISLKRRDSTRAVKFYSPTRAITNSLKTAVAPSRN